MKLRPSAALVVASILPLVACSSVRHDGAGAAQSPASSGPVVETHPLTCFPAPVTASVGDVPAAQQNVGSAPPASVAKPVQTTIELGQERANITLTSLSLRVVSHQAPHGAPSATLLSPVRGGMPNAVKTITVPAPRAGVVYTLAVDGTSDQAGVVPAPGVYDVDVVQDISVPSSCISDTVGGPDVSVEFHTTIGYVRLP
jgi:hypothetical protein